MNAPLNLRQVLALPPTVYKIDKVLPLNETMVLGGPPKTGKSRLMLDTCLRALRGRPAFGLFNQSADRVLIVNAEGGPQGIRERAEMYDTLPNEVLERLHVYDQPPPCFTTGDGRIAQPVFDRMAVEWAGYDLIVLDPLVNFHTCEENNNQQMAALLFGLQALAKRLESSIMIVHHTSKLGEAENFMQARELNGEKLRGASSIRGAATSIVVAWPVVKQPNRVTLGFDLRYKSKADFDEVILECDRVSGRFYRLVGDDKKRMPDAADFALDWGPGEQRYVEAFGATPEGLALARAVARPPLRLVPKVAA